MHKPEELASNWHVHLLYQTQKTNYNLFYEDPTINESMNQSMNQATNQATNQSTNRATNQSMNQYSNQSSSHSINNLVNQLIIHIFTFTICVSSSSSSGFLRSLKQFRLILFQFWSLRQYSAKETQVYKQKDFSNCLCIVIQWIFHNLLLIFTKSSCPKYLVSTETIVTCDSSFIFSFNVLSFIMVS